MWKFLLLNKDNIILLKDIISIIFYIIGCIGSIVAIYGLFIWKRQLKGKAEFELASKIIKSFYKVKYDISNARNKFMSSSEIDIDLIMEKFKVNNLRELPLKQFEAIIFNKRFTLLRDSIRDLYLEMLESKAYWGDYIENIFTELNSNISFLLENIELFLDEKENERNNEESKARKKIIFAHDFDKKNEFTQKIESIIKEAEDFLLPKMNVKKRKIKRSSPKT